MLHRLIITIAALVGMVSAAHAVCTTSTQVDNTAGPTNWTNVFIADNEFAGTADCDDDIADGVAAANAHSNTGDAATLGAANDYSDAGDAALDAKLSAQLDDAFEDSNALAAALSQPTWLSDSENFAISGGVGFTNGSTAAGATAILRFGRNLSGYAGGAVNTNDTDQWAGKAGARLGW